jgi:ABC-type transport system involved in cytochrome c biogenesis permease subunit
MNLLHIIIGIVVLIIFAITGLYMLGDFPDKGVISPDLRLLMRSRHIYILFSALLHLLAGVYFRPHSQRWRKILQLTGSFLMILGSVFLIWAFVVETYYLQHFSNLSRNGIITSAVGVGFHAIARILLKSK